MNRVQTATNAKALNDGWDELKRLLEVHMNQHLRSVSLLIEC